jgi:hypothetical protein
MISAIESVTVGVSDLDAGVRFFREHGDFSITSSARVSVGLLSAWRHPVHESVRVIELARQGHPCGRLRLAFYEDLPRVRESAPPARVGLALDLRAALDAPAQVVPGPGAVPVLQPQAQADASAANPLPFAAGASLWILAAQDAAAAHRFYTVGLGYVPAPTVTTPTKSTYLERFLDVQADHARLTVYRSGSEPAGYVVLVELPGVSPAQAMGLGPNGINLLTCRCDDLDEMLSRLAPLGLETLSAPSHVGLPDGRPARVVLVRGPCQELIELVEISD